MKLFGYEFSMQRESKGQTLTFDQFLSRLDALVATASGITVDPETCVQSPTVQAVITAVAGRISTLPIHVYQKKQTRLGATKEPVPNHPIARLLNDPKIDGVDRVSYWADAASWLIRYGNFYALKSQARTGPIRRLYPLPPSRVHPEQQDDFSVIYRVTTDGGGQRDYAASDIVHARGPSRNGYVGSSPIIDLRESIALEIAAERMGASFFGNGAMPSMIFQFKDGYQGFQTTEQRQTFLDTFHAAYGGSSKRFKGMVLPKGMDWKDVPVDNDKAQFLATRQYQRTVIAGGLGVPPHLVGDLQKATYNNVEQQSLDFILTVILPKLRSFEAALERDLLSPADRNNGLIIRFNLDAALRGDFKTRQEGLNIQRQAGVISANEWREREGMNPREGGDTYYEQGPSGQTAQPATDAPDTPSETPRDGDDMPNGKQWRWDDVMRGV